MKYAPYSHSKISTFEQCPRKFKYQYIDKIPIERKPQKHLDRGQFFHLLMEYGLENFDEIKKSNEFKEIQEHGLLNKEDLKEIINIYKKFISTKPGKDIVKHKALLKEFALGLDENLELVPYNSDKVLIRGYIDAAFIVDDRTDVCLIVDWKSGKYVPKEKQNWSQLLWYSLGLFSQNPDLEKIILVFAYLEHQKINTKIVQRKDLPRYKEEMMKKIQKIENEKDFPKVESPLCNFCDFREICMED
jgi:putative RecB family exonuclease